MVMMGRFAKDLRGFENLAGITGQNHCGQVVVLTAQVSPITIRTEMLGCNSSCLLCDLCA